MTTLGKYDLTFYALYANLQFGAVWTQLPLQSTEDKATPLPLPDDLDIWLWAPRPFAAIPSATPDTIKQLRSLGWDRLSQRPSDADANPYLIWGQLGEIRSVQIPGSDGQEFWARSTDLQRAKACSVTLAFTPDKAPESTHQIHNPDATAVPTYSIPEVLPPPQLGSCALAWVPQSPGNEDAGWRAYKLSELPPDKQILQHTMAEALRGLGDRSPRQSSRQELSPDVWLEKWEEIQRMAQQLAAAYWAAHVKLQGVPDRRTSLPPLTSAHRTLIPSHNAPRAIWQTFGPGVQPSIWNLDPENETIELHTPNRSLVQITPMAGGQEKAELAVLHRYVLEGLTPEGIKHCLGVLSAYADQTGGASQKEDARVSLRQLLLRIKPESHADDPEEQRKLFHTILYLARCAVHATNRPEDPRPPGAARRRKGKEYREYSPLLVIERVQFEETTANGEVKLRVPREVTFHLGADYYHLLFGEGRSFFTIPTSLLMSYHPDREQQELMLAMYLSDMLAWNHNPWRVTFHKIMIQSALESQQELEHGSHRTRDAQRVLLAIEHLERDGLLLRAEHSDIDTVLACELTLGNITPEALSDPTRKRLAQPPYRTLATQADQTALARSRRIALQRLLDGQAAALSLTAGPLLHKQIEQREAKRKEAEEQNERALAARVVKTATKIIVDAAQSSGQSSGVKPDAKRRGRPRKYP